jgi:hypothetical protein
MGDQANSNDRQKGAVIGYQPVAMLDMLKM